MKRYWRYSGICLSHFSGVYMADRLDRVSIYQLRRASALSRKPRRMPWNFDDALRFRYNFITKVNRSQLTPGRRGFSAFMFEGQLTFPYLESITRELPDIPWDEARAYWFLADQGLHRFYVKPSDHGAWGRGWQWAWRTSQVWHMFLPNIDYNVWVNAWYEHRSNGGPMPDLISP